MSERKIKIDGWNKGFQKVKASQLIRSELGLNIAESKYIVDQILLGDVVVLSCSNQQAETLVEELNSLGANAFLQ